jgi:hypothetical protein
VNGSWGGLRVNDFRLPAKDARELDDRQRVMTRSEDYEWGRAAEAFPRKP